jgi:hypothetical protein
MGRSTIVLVSTVAIVIVVAVILRNGDDGGAASAPTSAPSSTAPTDGTPDSATTPPPASSTSTSPTTTVTVPELPAGVGACDVYGSVTTTGQITSGELIEASGLAASRTTPGVLWSHNDSRGGPVLYAFDVAGTDLGVHEIPDAFAIDWEDMAAGPGPDGTGSFLYVGDTGDNFGIRDGVVNLWRVPDQDPATSGGAFSEAAAIVLRIPDGPHDTEGLFVDPVDPAVYLVTKSRDATFVFRGPLTPGTEPSPMELVATLFLGAEVTSADITADGATIAMRGYETVWMWERRAGQDIGEALAAQPCEAPSPEEVQGESIAFDGGRSYVTVSEGEFPPIHYVASDR